MSPIFNPIKGSITVKYSASDGTEQTIEQKFYDLAESKACMWAISRLLMPGNFKDAPDT